MSTKLSRTVLGLIALFVVSLVVASIITGGAGVVKLRAAPPLAYAVSQAMAKNPNDTLPQYGKDYAFESVRYFDDNNWVVVKMVPLHINGDSLFVVLKRVDGYYRPALDPSNSFSPSYVYTLPSDVGQYLNQLGVLNG